MGKRGYATGKDGLLVYQFTHPVTGKRDRFRGTRQECDARRAEIEAARRELGNGRPVAHVAARLTSPDRLTLAEVWETYLETRRPRARVKATQYWRTTIDQQASDADRRRLGAYRVAELTPAVLGAWAMRLATAGGRTGRGRSVATIQLALDYVGAAVRLVCVGVPLPWGSWRPPRGTAPAERPWLRSLDELGALLEVAAREDARELARPRLGAGESCDGAPLEVRGRYACRWYLAAFLALTGLRNAEAAGLGWDDVELDHGPPRITVRHQAPRGWTGERPTEPPKGRRVHSQALHPAAAEVLRRQRAQLRARGWYRPDGPVWPARGGGWLRTGKALEPSAVRRWARAAGLQRPDDWCVHSLRHSFASLETVASAGDLAAVARRTGHADLRELTRYVHALGTGLGTSAVGMPTLPGGVVVVEPPPPAGPCLPVALDPPPSLAATWDAEVSRATLARAEREAERRAASRRPLLELAREWLATRPERRRGANGQALERPQAVSDLVRRNGGAAYARAWRAAPELAPDDRREKASRSRSNATRATLARWARALGEAARE